MAKQFYWVGSSNDGAYDVESEKKFDNKEECYNDMRNAVLEKMKWNTEYREDFNIDINRQPIEDDNNSVSYRVLFFPHKIIHESFSGIYTYLIKETSTFVEEFTKMWEKGIKTFQAKKYMNLSPCLWVSDFSMEHSVADVNVWAEWTEKHVTDDIAKTYVNCDIYLPSDIPYSSTLEDIISCYLNCEPYDNKGTQNAYWRIEGANKETLEWLTEQLDRLDRKLSVIYCDPNDLIECVKTLKECNVPNLHISDCITKLEVILDLNGYKA